jgi:putative flippase GtrA
VVGWHYLPSQIIATGLVLVSGFVANRVWTFREKADEQRH